MANKVMEAKLLRNARLGEDIIRGTYYSKYSQGGLDSRPTYPTNAHPHHREGWVRARMDSLVYLICTMRTANRQQAVNKLSEAGKIGAALLEVNKYPSFARLGLKNDVFFKQVYESCKMKAIERLAREKQQA